MPETQHQRVRDLLRRHPIVDGHNDLPWTVRMLAAYDLEAFDLSLNQPSVRTDLPRLAEGGVGAQFWSAWVPASLSGDSAVVATLEQIDFVHRLVRRYPHRLAFARTADDVRRSFASDRIACLVGVEGGHSIAESLGVLRTYAAMGVAYLTLTHNDNVPWADSATDTPAVDGLSPFGRTVIDELNRLGMLIDLAHVHTLTMHAALDATRAPVIFSHSSCRSLCDHPRNVPDDVLAKLSGNGGVCMVTFVPEYVSQEFCDWDQALTMDMERRGLDPKDFLARMKAVKDYEHLHPRPRATCAQVADHLDHAREVAGVDHIGIGSDFDGWWTFPEDLQDVSGYPGLIAE
ncbi:dipeptidase, partial [Streptomyces sp. NPDC002920]